MKDSFGSMWYSRGQGVGAWLQVVFKGLFVITKFEVKPRGNPNERNKVLQLEFSDGSKQSFPMLNTDSVQTFKVGLVQTSYVIVKFLEVYGTINNGGSFNFYGIECKNLALPEKPSKSTNGLLKAAGVIAKHIIALFKSTKEEVIGVGCKDTLVNNFKKFLGVKMAQGNHMIINCYSSCSITPYLIYGTDRYTKDSAICKAAFHARKITASGGKVKLATIINL